MVLAAGVFALPFRDIRAGEMNKNKPFWRRGAIIVVGAFLLLGLLPAWAQDTDGRYFPETGFNVSGEFLEFYDQHGGLAILGYPLTREFEENGLRVQYFQRVRMEKHPENPYPYQVQLGLLGDLLGYRQAPIPASEIPPPDHPDKKYFVETGHTVTFSFLKFFLENGGLDVFGYPITEWIIEPNGRIVQYFQRGKLEWYPENPPGQRVQLGMLGAIYVEQFVDPVHRQPEEFIRSGTPSPTTTPVANATSAPRDIRALTMSVTPKFAIIGLNGTQVLYIYVRDQDGHGAPGVSVEVWIEYKNDQRQQFSLLPTNANGYTQLEFPIQDAPPGFVVIVNLSARYGDVQTTTSTAFLPWW